MGSGGGGVAMVEDGSAAWLNPGGLSRIRRPTINLGMVMGVDNFNDVPDLYWDTNRDGAIDERDPPLEWSTDVPDVQGFQFHVGRQIGGKFGFGMMAWLPMRRLYRLSTIEPDLPHYITYENRPQRFVLAAGIGGEIVRGVNVGVSLDSQTMPRFTLHGTLDATIGPPGSENEGVEGIVRRLEVDVHDLELDLGYAVLPVIGTQLELGRWNDSLEGLVVGASFRPGRAILVDADLDVQTNIALEDFGDLDPYFVGSVINLQATLFDTYVPPRLGLGAALRSEDVFSAYFDATWEDWRRGRVHVTEINETVIQAPLFRIDDAVVDANGYEVDFRSTWSLRTGVNLKLPEIALDNRWKYLQVSVRGGAAFVPSPLRGQGENSAFLDSTRSQFTLGAGFEFHDPFELVDAPVWFNVFAQAHILGAGTLPRQTDVPRAGFPINASGIPVGGNLIIAGAEWGFEY